LSDPSSLRVVRLVTASAALRSPQIPCAGPFVVAGIHRHCARSRSRLGDRRLGPGRARARRRPLKVKERLSGSGALVATEARRGWVVWLASWSVSGIAAVVSAERLAGIDQREY